MSESTEGPAVADPRLQFSVSMLDLATTVCFLDHQETKSGPRQIEASEVDLLIGFCLPISITEGSNGKGLMRVIWSMLQATL